MSQHSNKLWPHKSTRQFRDLCRELYPGLGNEPINWHILGHCLFGPRLTGHVEEEGRILLTCYQIAAMAGVPRNHSNAEETMLLFEARTGIPLNHSDWDHSEGRARTIEPEIDPQIVAAREQLTLAQIRGTGADWVDFVSGKPISRKRRRQELKAREDAQRAAAAMAGEDHPAGHLCRFLNDQQATSLSYRVSKNLPAVTEAALALPPGLRRDGAFRVLHRIAERVTMIYRPSERTPRLWVEDLSIHLLCREMRLLALNGDMHLDLRSSQLAIATRLCDLPEVEVILHSGQSFWDYLLTELGLPESSKPFLKEAVYSTLYGKSKKHLRESLARFMAAEAVEAYLNHRVIRALFREKARACVRIRRAGGADDAFGVWQAIRKDRKPHQIFCSVAQSYEMKVMLGCLPVLLAHRNAIRVHSWLHDGMTIDFAFDWQAEELTATLVAVIDAEARQLGIPTRVEVSK